MLQHIVLFEIKPDAAEADVEKLITEAHAKLTQIPGVSNLRAARVLQADAPHQVALSMDLPDEAALGVYRTHPLHLDYVENAIKPVELKRYVLDLHF